MLVLGNWPKTAVFGCFTNAIASPLIALESCSNPQWFSKSSNQQWKNFLVLGFRFFV